MSFMLSMIGGIGVTASSSSALGSIHATIGVQQLQRQMGFRHRLALCASV
jgi:hypothetical protein